MLAFNKSDGPCSKAFVSNGTLPAYIDTQQPPTAKKPFSTISKQVFTHKVELVLPEELYDLIWRDISSTIGNLQYSRVIMSPSELLEGEFFNNYVKSGNILMLSEGRPGVDNQYMLKDGQLRLDLAKETYERTGLLGKPIRDSGRKHIKTRYSIEIDLRLPSMLHGKKSFERIVWAFKNVLNRSITWLFHNLKTTAGEPRPLAKHHPFHHIATPQRQKTDAVLIPPLDLKQATISNIDFEDWALDVYEWLGLVSLQSPRIQFADSVDPYLSRYRVPAAENRAPDSCNMISLSWQGLVPASWIRDLFNALSDACSKIDIAPTTTAGFFALSAHAFKTEVAEQHDGYTILWLSDKIVGQSTIRTADKSRQQKHAERHGREYVLWEIVDN